MSLQRLGPRKLRRIQWAVWLTEGDRSHEPGKWGRDHANRTVVVRAVVASHWDDFWMWYFVTRDHLHGWFDSRTGEWAYYGHDKEWCVSSCDEFPDHAVRRDAQNRRDRMEQLRARVERTRLRMTVIDHP